MWKSMSNTAKRQFLQSRLSKGGAATYKTEQNMPAWLTITAAENWTGPIADRAGNIIEAGRQTQYGRTPTIKEPTAFASTSTNHRAVLVRQGNTSDQNQNKEIIPSDQFNNVLKLSSSFFFLNMSQETFLRTFILQLIPNNLFVAERHLCKLCQSHFTIHTIFNSALYCRKAIEAVIPIFMVFAMSALISNCCKWHICIHSTEICQ